MAYYAVIPVAVMHDKRLTPNAKLLYGEITLLASKSGVCFASNDYFAKAYSTNERTIRRWIVSLIEAGYIEVTIGKSSSGERTDWKRAIRIKDGTMGKEGSVGQKCPHDGGQKCPHNITSRLNTTRRYTFDIATRSHHSLKENPNGFTERLIKGGYISESDDDIDKYNRLLGELSDEYGNDIVMKAIDYFLKVRERNSDVEITNKYSYFEKSVKVGCDRVVNPRYAFL